MLFSCTTRVFIFLNKKYDYISTKSTQKLDTILDFRVGLIEREPARPGLLPGRLKRSRRRGFWAQRLAGNVVNCAHICCRDGATLGGGVRGVRAVRGAHAVLGPRGRDALAEGKVLGSEETPGGRAGRARARGQRLEDAETREQGRGVLPHAAAEDVRRWAQHDLGRVQQAREQAQYVGLGRRGPGEQKEQVRYKGGSVYEGVGHPECGKFKLK